MVLAQKGALGTKGDQALMMKNDEKSRLTCRSDFELNLLVISLPFSLRSYYPLTLFFSFLFCLAKVGEHCKLRRKLF